MLSYCVGLILQWFILLLFLCFVCFLLLLPLMANKVVCVRLQKQMSPSPRPIHRKQSLRFFNEIIFQNYLVMDLFRIVLVYLKFH